MSYNKIYDIVSFLVDNLYISFPDMPHLTKSKFKHYIVEDIVEHFDSNSLFDKDEYTINLLRDIKRLLNTLDE